MVGFAALVMDIDPNDIHAGLVPLLFIVTSQIVCGGTIDFFSIDDQS